MSTTVSTIAQLNTAIVADDSLTAPGTVTIALGSDVALSGTALEGIDLHAGVTLDIVGNGHTLSGGGTERGLFVYAGTVDLQDLTLAGMTAKGGAGGSGGGGGAGLGGGLFVGANVTNDVGNVMLTGVTFLNDAAAGGAGASGASGGGGGLGGLGGRGGFGGGGIGNTSVGGPGLVPGAGTAAAGSGGAGGASGGGGGHATGSGAGGGGGVGGGVGAAPATAVGGFGGFGGGGGSSGTSAPGGAGGFGGGGGGGHSAGGGGGFGGGGGGASSNSGVGGVAGFGGGNGAHAGNGVGGGGLAAGGDIFVQSGASLSIAGGSVVNAGTVTAGTAASGAVNGQAFATGIYLQGSNDLSFAPAANQTVTVAGVIGDDAGSAAAANYTAPVGYTMGSVGVVVNGSGTVLLNGADTYTGGTTLDAGTLELGTSGSAGSGAIGFGTGAAVLQSDAVIATSGTFANAITGLTTSDAIDLRGLAYAAGATAALSGGTLAVTSGAVTETLAVAAATGVTFTAFSVAGDGAGGSLIQGLTSLPVTLAATYNSTATLGAGQTLSLLSGVAITDPNPGQTETATITLGNPAAGTLSLGNGYAGGLTLAAGATAGSYVLAGAPAAAEAAALDALVFTPTTGAGAQSTGISLTVADSAGASAGTADAAPVTVDPGPGLAALSAATMETGATLVLGTLAPGLAGDTLTLDASTLSAGGTLSLQSAGGVEQVVLTAPAGLAAATADAVSYTVSDQYGDTVSGSATATVLPVPTISALAAAVAGGGAVALTGATIGFTLTPSAAVSVTGTPALTLSDGGVATFSSLDAGGKLVFTTTVTAGQNAPDLTVTGLVANGASIALAPGALTAGATGDTPLDTAGISALGGADTGIMVNPTVTLAATYNSTATLGAGQTLSLLSGVAITDPNPGQTETATITLGNPAAGTLSLGNGYAGGLTLAAGATAGSYVLAGAPAAAEAAAAAAAAAAALDALVFTAAVPASSGTISTGISLTVADSAGASASTADAAPIAVTAEVHTLASIPLSTTGTLTEQLLTLLVPPSSATTVLSLPDTQTVVGTAQAPIILPAVTQNTPDLLIPAADQGVISVPSLQQKDIYQGTGTLEGGAATTAIIGTAGVLNYSGGAGTIIGIGAATGGGVGTVAAMAAGAQIGMAGGDELVFGRNDNQTYRFDAGSSTLVGTGTGAAVSVDGSAAVMLFMAAPATFTQTGGSMTLGGGAGGNTVRAGAGNSVIFGGAAGDVVSLGAGAAEVVNAAGRSSITAGSGADTVVATSGVQYAGGSGRSLFIGGTGSSTVYAAAQEVAFGGSGSEAVSMRAGGSLVFVGGGGSDSIVAGSGAPTVWGHANEHLTVSGSGKGAVYVLAGSGNQMDLASAGGGAYVLAAEGGALAGSDQVTMSSAGNDTLVLFAGSEIGGAPASPQTITIANWQANDVLGLASATVNGQPVGYTTADQMAAQQALGSGQSVTLSDGTKLVFVGATPAAGHIWQV